MPMPSLSYLGRHTTISHLSRSEWRHIPYLKDNGGALPPFVLAVGDARRVAKAVKVLKLAGTVYLHEEGEHLLGLVGRGRVDIVLGVYSNGGKRIPIVVCETQMGMPATEINLREVLSHCRREYVFGKEMVKTDGIYLIRAGTAGAINTGRGGSDEVKVGDIVNAAFSIGWSGAMIESIAGLDYSSKAVMAKFRRRWVGMGHEFTKDGKFPLMRSSDVLINAISKAADEVGVRSFTGGNFSKDSLYAETDDRAFVKLRKKYGVMSTEMEQMAMGRLIADLAAKKITLHTGLVSGIIGSIPGGSFAAGKGCKRKTEKAEENALKVAARVFWNVVHLRIAPLCNFR